MAIALTIIGILTVAVLKGQALIDQSRAEAAIKTAEDMAIAVREFKTKYKLWPGDMPNPPFAGLLADCAAGGNGNGRISAVEARCIPDVLTRAGMIKSDGIGDSGFEINYPIIRTHYGLVRAISVLDSNVFAARGANLFAPSTRFIVELENLTCEAAQALDRKIDDDNLNAGRVIASVPGCVIGGVADPIRFIGMAI